MERLTIKDIAKMAGVSHTHCVPGAEWGAEHPTRDLCQDHGALPDDRLHA